MDIYNSSVHLMKKCTFTSIRQKVYFEELANNNFGQKGKRVDD